MRIDQREVGRRDDYVPKTRAFPSSMRSREQDSAGGTGREQCAGHALSGWSENHVVEQFFVISVLTVSCQILPQSPAQLVPTRAIPGTR